MNPLKASLEDVFMELTRDAQNGGAGADETAETAGTKEETENDGDIQA
jgi:hypothetical protein